MGIKNSKLRLEDLVVTNTLEKELQKRLRKGKPAVKYYLVLGTAYYARYKKDHQHHDLKTAITYYRSGLDNVSSDRSYQVRLLINLGVALRAQYLQLGNFNLLEEAITYHNQALDLSPPGHRDRIPSLNGLANALQSRHEQLGQMEDLRKAIIYLEQKLELCPPGHSSRFLSLGNLSLALKTRYEQLGDIGDLERAINGYEQALDLCPPGDSNKTSLLNNFATALRTRYDVYGEIEDLERSITGCEEVLDICALTHPDRPVCLGNLALSLGTRYGKFGEMENLERAIICYNQALELCTPGWPFRFTILHNLAGALQTRYTHLGQMDDLDGAIVYHEQSLNFHQTGNPHRSIYLNDYATALYTRYDEYKDRQDLKEAIFCYEQSLELCTPGHSSIPIVLNGLARALHTSFDLLGDTNDLKKAIICHEQELELHPAGHPDQATSLKGLSSALYSKYTQLGEIEDLSRSIIYGEQALELWPSGHPNRPLALASLATAFQDRYDHLVDIADLEIAIYYCEQALYFHPHGDPSRSGALYALGSAFYRRFSYQRFSMLYDPEDLMKAVNFFEEGALHEDSGLLQRLECAKGWATVSHKHGIDSAISAYANAMNLLQQLISLLPSLISQQKVVERSSDLSLNAASCAIASGLPDVAIQFLDQGRSMLWSKIQGYRQSYDDLLQKAPQLAEALRTVSQLLEQNVMSANMDIELQDTLSQNWKNLMKKIRNLDGFSYYLQATPYEVLQNAAAEGPVIMVNISTYRSDAIILVSHRTPLIIPLEGASPKILKELVDQLSQATSSSNSKRTYTVLRHLWDIIGNPVVKQLIRLNVPEKTHLWWCPTSYLCALPLHAAGPYGGGIKGLADMYISSYTPTLTSLIRARSYMPKPQSIPTLLLVGQPDDTIPHVFEEVQVINSLKVQVKSCVGSDAHKEEVLASLHTYPWVHFACHGHLDPQPFNSWFQLHKKEHLAVLDLTKAQIINAEFAFLSACHSAAGGVYGTPDESIHLAGALQFSGFMSVVGTLWAMVDDDGPAMANAFYKYMLRNQELVDLRDAAASLHMATKELRRQKVSVDRWINFIHIGA